MYQTIYSAISLSALDSNKMVALNSLTLVSTVQLFTFFWQFLLPDEEDLDYKNINKLSSHKTSFYLKVSLLKDT